MPETKTIALTGATRGLGRAMTEGFAALGHAVLGCGRDEAQVRELTAAFPSGDFAVVDVTDAKAVDAWAKRLIEEHGAPDLLINNAAIMNRVAPLWEIRQEEMAAMLDVNVAGTANAIRAFVPAMIERGRGVIVNVSSGWGRSTSPDVGPYCTTKWAIEGLSRSLADDLPPGLASVALNPGIIDTDMLRECWGNSAGAYPSASRWAESAVPFLLSLGPEHNGQPLTAPD